MAVPLMHSVHVLMKCKDCKHFYRRFYPMGTPDTKPTCKLIMITKCPICRKSDKSIIYMEEITVPTEPIEEKVYWDNRPATIILGTSNRLFFPVHKILYLCFQFLKQWFIHFFKTRVNQPILDSIERYNVIFQGDKCIQCYGR